MSDSKLGRPPIEFNYEKVGELAALQGTYAEIAAGLGCSEDTITRRMQNDEKFAEAIKRARADGRISLRRAQWENAESGNATMQIWLGKQWLNQTDRIEQTHQGPEGGPITHADWSKLMLEDARRDKEPESKDNPKGDTDADDQGTEPGHAGSREGTTREK